MVHRDIKPGNLLVAADAKDSSRRNVVKILDMARAPRTATPTGPHVPTTQTGTVIGTPDYVPRTGEKLQWRGPSV